MNQQIHQIREQAANAVQQAQQTLNQANSNPSPELFKKAQQEVNQGKKVLNDLYSQSGLSIQLQQIEHQLNQVQESISQTQQILYNQQNQTVQPNILH